MRHGCDDQPYSSKKAMVNWTNLTLDSLDKIGVEGRNTTTQYKKLMEESGFVNVVYRWPSNSWPKNPYTD